MTWIVDLGGSPFFAGTVPEYRVRALARRRATVALVVLPALVAVGVAAVMLSVSLAPITLMCVLVACGSGLVAVNQRRVAATASMLEFGVDHGRLNLTTVPPPGRRIVRAIWCQGYVRLLTSRSWFAGLWFTIRQDPAVGIDVPLPRNPSPHERFRALKLFEALQAAAVPVRGMRHYAAATVRPR